ncbi:MAG: hypothetical protein ACYCYO_18840 [Bacilli bacterium]
MDSQMRRFDRLPENAQTVHKDSQSQPPRRRFTNRKRFVSAALIAAFASCATIVLAPASAPASAMASAAGAAVSQTVLMGTNLIPDHPIPLVTGPIGSAQNISRIPVVVLPFSSAGEMAKPADLPTTVLAPVPPNAAKRLAAYLFPINQCNWVYMIGPRKMKGTAELAADGGASVKLQNAHASLTLRHVGGSPLIVEGMASQFFAAAGEDLNHAGLGLKWSRRDLLQNASIAYRYEHRLALYAFQSKQGQSVYGYGFFQPSYIGPYSMAAQFVYSADNTDASLAPWVMASSLSTLTQIGEPQLSGTPIAAPMTPVPAGNRTYRLPVPKGFNTQGMALPTSAGVAWIGQPTWLNTGNGMRADIPSGSFSINLSPPGTKTLAYPSVRELTTVASYRLGTITDAPWYMSVYLMQTAGPNWLLYGTYFAAVGMNQPAGNDLYAIRLQGGHPIPEHITSFLDAGGYFFSLGAYGQYVVYDQSDDLDAHGIIFHHIWLVDLSTGKRVHLASSALHGSTVTTVIHGKRVRIGLRNY